MSLLAVPLALLLLGIVAWFICVRMPGNSHRGPLPPPTDFQRALAPELERDVRVLAEAIGERSGRRWAATGRTVQYLRESFAGAGLEPRDHDYSLVGFDVVPRTNVFAEIRGSDVVDEIVIIGAHYDSVEGSPGANDNATGVAAMLAMARRFARSSPQRTLRFVAFGSEEAPAFGTDDMGSLRYARDCKAKGESVVAMLSLETLGCYSDAPGSQRYPISWLGLVYPSRGEFVAFVGNIASRALVREAIGAFREAVEFPSEGAALPGWIPGVGWSDQWSFWQQGWPAIMVTDTAPFRDPRYHTAADKPDQVDYERLARVVEGLHPVVARLTGIPAGGG
jgi:hypothetical protein